MAGLLPRKAKTEEHGTPRSIFNPLNVEFGFTLDAAASDKNHKCPKYYTKAQDGTKQSWASETVFCNPPYNVNDLLKFTQKGVFEARKNWVTSVFLVPVKSDQEWWHLLWNDTTVCVEYRWIRGRVKYEGNDNSAGFPSVIIVIEPKI